MEEELYYLKTEGFNGDALIWWRPNSGGYTINLNEAGKYPKSEAIDICKSSHGETLAFNCKEIDESDCNMRIAYAGKFPLDSVLNVNDL